MTELATALKDFALILQALGPWGIVFFIWWDGKKESKKWEERHQAVVEMYKNNVELVKSYDEISKGYQDIVIFNTQIMTQVKDRVDANLFCPMLKEKTKQKEVVG